MPRIGIFKDRHKPTEVVKVLKENFAILEKGEKKNTEKLLEEISKYLSVMKGMLYGTAEQEPQTEQVTSLAQEIYHSNLLEITHIFNNMLRRQIGKIYPTVDYLLHHTDVLSRLLHGYEDPEIALHCGAMLRECCRHEYLTKHVIDSPDFFNFFIYVELSTFDIASDAFSTFKEFLIRHKTLAANFLEENYNTFFELYEKLLLSENYVTRRQSLKLLSELLLYRSNFSVMARYISNPDNLKLMMNLFREKSSHIQFEAFHVFKIFVANPNKPKAISDILVRNRDKLIDFLTTFNTDRTDDEQFCDEKAYLIKQIKELKEQDISTTVRSGSSNDPGSAFAGGISGDYNTEGPGTMAPPASKEPTTDHGSNKMI
ncbi:hypothetical protein GJ496_003641 [Pomphorhynchus laevis]|nr:hypothetical protein GJ496_003641 [Pomphorhynchus laevis]